MLAMVLWRRTSRTLSVMTPEDRKKFSIPSSSSSGLSVRPAAATSSEFLTVAALISYLPLPLLLEVFQIPKMKSPLTMRRKQLETVFSLSGARLMAGSVPSLRLLKSTLDISAQIQTAKAKLAFHRRTSVRGLLAMMVRRWFSESRSLSSFRKGAMSQLRKPRMKARGLPKKKARSPPKKRPSNPFKQLGNQ